MSSHHYPTPEDVVACEQLMYSYALRADNKDADGVAGLFTADAVLNDGTGGIHEGREAVHSFYSSALNPERRSQHSVSNMHFTLGDGPDVIDIDAQLHAYSWTDESAAIIVGRYRNTLRRDDQGWWQIARKNIVYERRIDL